MNSPALDELPPEFRRHLSERDLRKNSTLQSFENVRKQLTTLEQHRDSIDVILDVGCSRGGFVAALGEHLGAETVYGIDTDDEMRKQARKRGVTTFDVNVEEDAFPLEQDSVDLVLSFGLIEHLRCYDNLFEEVDRVLRNGWFWITTPNLGSWINRFALLTGHQPRNVEISQQRAAGVLPVYRQDKCIGHVHAPTYKALLELLKHHGFDPKQVVSLTPYQHSKLVRMLDALFSVRLSWSRRIGVLAKQSSEH